MGKLIMCIEDDPDQRCMMQEVLQLYGFEVLTAPEGRTALRQLREGPIPDLIFLDITMPVMSGRQFLDAIHTETERPFAHIPIVVISAVIEFIDLSRYHNCVAQVRKPLLINTLLEYADRFAR